VLDLYSHEQEVDFANDNVLQMVPDTGIITISAYATNILDFCLADLHSPQVRPGPQNTFADHHHQFIIISLLKPHVRRTCLHNKNITNETQRVILIKNELK